MNSKITFYRINNFWIDNGIVGLFKVLEQIKEYTPIEGESGNIIDYNLSLNSNSLKIELINSSNLDLSNNDLHPDLLKVLNTAKDEVVKTYLTATNSAGWLLCNNMFEVYRKNDFKMHLKSFFTGKTPKTEGGICVLFDKKEIERILIKYHVDFKKDKDGIITLVERYFKNYKGKKEEDKKEVSVPNIKKDDVKASDRLMSEEEFISFLTFIEDNSPVTIDGSKPVSLTGRGFLNTQPMYEIGEEFSNKFLEEGNKLCSFSGKRVKYADVVTGMNFPFMTGKSGELNFVSNLEAKPIVSFPKNSTD